LAEGSTVLEGISRAGGFGLGAFTKRLRIIKATGELITLNLHWRQFTNERCWGAWYEESPKQSIVSPKDTPKDLVHDHVLQCGDKVIVEQVYL
jgi:hypothetical protein